MNRRELIQSLIGLWAIQGCRPFSFGPSEVSQPEKWFYSGIEFAPAIKEGKKTYGVSASRFSESRTFHVENVIHSVVYDQESKLKVFLPKAGAEAYYQIADGPLIPFAPAPGKHFYGHGAFDRKRKVFYTTQSEISLYGPSENRKYSEGLIYAHSIHDFKIVEKFPTFGNDPHDVTVVGDELIVCNGGHNSNVSIIDLTTRKLVKSYLLNDELLSIGHLEVLDPENFIVVTGAYREHYPPGIFSLNRETGLTKFPFPKGLDFLFRVQLLSVVSYQGYILATCPHTNSLFAWNKNKEFVGAHKITQVTSLAVSEDLGGVIVGTGENTEPLRLISFSENKMKVKTLDWGLRSTGSHALVV